MVTCESHGTIASRPAMLKQCSVAKTSEPSGRSRSSVASSAALALPAAERFTRMASKRSDVPRRLPRLTRALCATPLSRSSQEKARRSGRALP
eukprot:6016019-Prymnesium_polylepis.1